MAIGKANWIEGMDPVPPTSRWLLPVGRLNIKISLSPVGRLNIKISSLSLSLSLSLLNKESASLSVSHTITVSEMCRSGGPSTNNLDCSK